MKKVKQLILIPALVVAAVIVSLFAGCAAKDKVFSVQGMNITLTDKFQEQTYITQTAVWQTNDKIVTAIKESFSDIGSSTYSNTKYMELVARNNGLTVTVSENETYAYFTYNKTVSGKNFYYYATGRKGPDAYWLIQFACLESEIDKHQSDFEKYAASVTFDDVTAVGTM